MRWGTMRIRIRPFHTVYYRSHAVSEGMRGDHFGWVLPGQISALDRVLGR